jgi:hypothetical protein
MRLFQDASKKYEQKKGMKKGYYASYARSRKRKEKEKIEWSNGIFFIRSTVTI